jgi:hypothetical protein
VSDNKLEKRSTEIIKEKSQYAIAFGVIAMMLYITGFPIFVIFFFGILAYFIWKTLSTPSHNGTREIFEFYLMANEILRDDERRWYGFEIQDVIARGERILKYMNGAPPLVYFTLGALYHKIGDHKSAVNQLSYVLENENSEETTYVYPSPELRSYVKTLRKIEREPAEAPLMSAAVRALERARRNRGKSLLAESREALSEIKRKKRESALEQKKQKELAVENNQPRTFLTVVTDAVQEEIEAQQKNAEETAARAANGSSQPREKRKKEKSGEDIFANRKPISEVLHDIYDKNIQ